MLIETRNTYPFKTLKYCRGELSKVAICNALFTFSEHAYVYRKKSLKIEHCKTNKDRMLLNNQIQTNENYLTSSNDHVSIQRSNANILINII